MQNIRKVILYLASGIGTWLLISFGGAMLDSSNAAFWSSSLMWSILSFLVVMPALALMNDYSAGTQGDPAPEASSQNADQKSFVDEDKERVDTLWPEADEANRDHEWPPAEAQTRDHVRA